MKKLSLMTLGMSACATIASAQVMLTIDESDSWVGYMNVFDLADGAAGGFLWGSPWGTADLAASFTGIGELTLQPNTNTYAPGDAYWVDAETGLGAKFLSANMYVQDDTLLGQSLSFGFSVVSQTLAEHDLTAFVKVFDGGYGVLDSQIVSVASTGDYNLSMTADVEGGVHVQYGFTMEGLPVDPSILASYGSAVITEAGGISAIPEPSALGLLLGLITLAGFATRRRRG